ncbi:MAG: alpha-amylase [Rhodothermaceae bacterium]|nr:MAG: alpha-amylase [Rhodothermaceae bacterium]
MTTDPLPWWQTGVIYQIYPRSFKDSNGDGIGDLGGVLEKLDYLSDTLGVDAIWLSPFYPSPMADFGYDVADYTDVDPIFGDLATFDALVAEAHRRGLRVIIDIVPNHTSDRHPWFIASRSSRDNPKRDWYVWRDPAPDGGPPNNWLSVFGGPAWEYDETTGQYYLHSFLKEQPDLNWRNPEVRRAMFDVFRFWLERGVDGFRIDVAHYIMKDPLFRDNPPNPHRGDYHKDMGEYDTQLHLYDKGHEDVHEVFRELRRLLDDYSRDRPRFAVGEIHIFDWNAWVRYYGDNLDELHMPFNFALLKAGWDARAIREVVDGLEAALPEGAWPNYVLGNHDEQRIATRYGRAQSRVAAMLLLTLRGTPTLYYGDEIGMREGVIPPEQQQDPWGLRVPGLGRDGCRTPMQWDASHAAGFTTAPEPWLPVNDDYPTVNVAAELEDPRSMLTLYRRLLALRRQWPALHRGTYAPVDGTPDDTFVYQRRDGDQTVLVALNFGGKPVEIALPRAFHGGRVLLSTHLDRDDEPAGPTVTLRGHEGLLLTP